MKTRSYSWIQGEIPRIPNLGTRWRWMVSFTLRPLYPRERATGTLWIKGGVSATERTWRRKEKSLPLIRIECRPNARTHTHFTIWMSRLIGFFYKTLNLLMFNI